MSLARPRFIASRPWSHLEVRGKNCCTDIVCHTTLISASHVIQRGHSSPINTILVNALFLSYISLSLNFLFGLQRNFTGGIKVTVCQCVLQQE